MSQQCCPIPLTAVGPRVTPKRLSKPCVHQPCPSRLHPTSLAASHGGRCVDATPPRRLDQPRREPPTPVPLRFYLIPCSPYADHPASIESILYCRLHSMPDAVPTIPVPLLVVWPHPLVFANLVFAMPVPGMPIRRSLVLTMPISAAPISTTPISTTPVPTMPIPRPLVSAMPVSCHAHPLSPRLCHARARQHHFGRDHAVVHHQGG